MLTCRWCGSPLDEDCDFAPILDGHSAVWCPDCDGLTFVDPGKDTRRMLLFLENRSSSVPKDSVPYVAPPSSGLRKRLSPLRYPGGKSKVIDQIYAALLPEKMDTFVELFAGGASLGLSLLDAGKINRLVLNDLDAAVFVFWDVITTNSEDFASYILRMEPPTREDFFKAQEFLEILRENGPSILSGVDDAVAAATAFLVVNRLSFGGIQMAKPLGGKNGSMDSLLSRWNPKVLSARIRHIGSMSDKIVVRSCDASDFLAREIGWLPENTTIFVAPPYVGVGKKLYPLGFEKEHKELASTLNEFFTCYPGPDIIITYDECQEVRQLYPFAEVRMLSTSYSIVQMTGGAR